MTSPAADPVVREVAASERLLAGVFMSLLLVHLPGLSLVPASVPPALFLAIPMLSTAGKAIRRLSFWTAAAVATGGISLWVSVSSGLPAPRFDTWASVALWIVAIPLLPAAAMWSMKRIRPRTAILLMLGGGIVSTLLNAGFAWKGTLGIFVTGFLLILLARHAFLSFAALFLVVIASFLSDARSMAVAAVAALIVQVILSAKGVRRRAFWRAAALAAGIGAALLIAPRLLTSGIAGAATQARTLDQLSRGNLIFGVRAEWAATIELLQQRPLGFGIGVQPSPSDAGGAIGAVQAAGGDYTAAYFSQVVLGDRVDLHSTAANLWFHFGLAGIAVAILLAVILLRGIRDSSATAATLGMGGIFLMLMAFWDLLFSPMADLGRLLAGVIIALSVAFLSRGVQPGDISLATERSTTRRPRLPRTHRQQSLRTGYRAG
ncbi:hypothetical protein E4V99_03495 [Microbacterium sp. dk485]|uniref:O-antigen ligase family protein n=1 Tax=Microbacterium sp. dk485 TaxID=2560021 RepID=UPI001072FB30|nr:O-antigen ligase family protein [Microbacterium sp. dk485]TFV84148.1 hypothetical protein E4V99_03495 [Microbacterium sp. dk485]